MISEEDRGQRGWCWPGGGARETRLPQSDIKAATYNLPRLYTITLQMRRIAILVAREGKAEYSEIRDTPGTTPTTRMRIDNCAKIPPVDLKM